MKKIINGKLYDTDTARLIGSWANTGDRRSLSYVGEELYCKRTGEYFLYGEGGAMSHYSRSTGDNSWSGGEAIIPLSFGKARAWAEEHLSADEYAEALGLPDEDAEDVALNIMIPARIMAQVRQAASAQKMSLTDYVRAKLGGDTE